MKKKMDFVSHKKQRHVRSVFHEQRPPAPACRAPPSGAQGCREGPRSMLPESDGKHGFAASDGVVLSHFQQPCSL